MQVYKLATELGISSQVILKTLKAWDFEMKGPFSVIPDAHEAQLRKVFPVEEKIPLLPPDTLTPGEEIKQPKKMSKPWDNKSWVPDVFRLNKKHAGFTPRFIDKNKTEKRIDEGWRFASVKDYLSKDAIMERQRDEEKPLGTQLTRRGMVLMEIPNDLLAKKRAYIEHKTDRQSVDSNKQEMLNKGKEITRMLGENGNLVREGK